MLTITLPENSPEYFETHATKFLEGLGKPYVLKKEGDRLDLQGEELSEESRILLFSELHVCILLANFQNSI